MYKICPLGLSIKPNTVFLLQKDESESNDLQPNRVPIPVEVPQKTVDSLVGGVRQYPSRNEEQACRVADKGERSNDKNKARGSSGSSLRKNEGNNEKNNARGTVTEGQSAGQACVRDALPRKRSSDGQRRTERNYSRPSRGQEQRGGSREEFGQDRSKPRKAEMSRRERDSRRKDEKILNQAKESKVVGSLEQENTKSGGKKEDVCPSDAKHGEREGKEKCPTKDSNFHSEDPDSQEKSQLSSEEQAKEKEVRLSLDAKDGGKKEKDVCQTSRLNLSTTPTKPSTQRRNMESKNRKEYRSSDARNGSNIPTSKQIPRKQHGRNEGERNESQRKPRGGRTSTPRRPQQESKNYKPVDEKKYQKSYSSIASGNKQAESSKRKDQKRNDLPVSENNNKSGNKSDKNFSQKADKSSSNVGENVVKKHDGGVQGINSPIRRPPPGFENVKPAGVVEDLEKGQRVLSREAGQPVHDNPSTTRAKPQRRRVPPGFESVKPSVKKL